ncbi:MAG: pyroglutamyl-peptidase I [Proteobacteria bacterium]|nr:pyroglutamyl-peptidase I [Pseudomonadota bacterium]
MNTPTVLLAGFEPFGGEQANPAQDVVRALDGRVIAGHRVASRVLPVTFAAAAEGLSETIATLRPSLAIGIGQAGGRSRISIERVAINLIDARIPDNAGVQPVDAPVVAGAPAAYFTTLPVKAMLAALHAADVPAEASFSAGSFVCNTLFYALMHTLAAHHPSTRGGFIHVPWLPAQAVRHPGAASMAIATLSQGIAIAIEAALMHAQDLHAAGGSTH